MNYSCKESSFYKYKYYQNSIILDRPYLFKCNYKSMIIQSNTDQMQRTNSIFLNIRCKYCNAPAQRVCTDTNCEFYAFLCSVDSKCLDGHNVANIFHDNGKHKKGSIISLRQFQKIIKQSQILNFQHKNDNIETIISTIFSKIKSMHRRYQEKVQYSQKPSYSEQAQNIISELFSEKTIPNLESRKIKIIMEEIKKLNKNKNLFGLKNACNNFISLLSSVDKYLQDFENNNFLSEQVNEEQFVIRNDTVVQEIQERDNNKLYTYCMQIAKVSEEDGKYDFAIEQLKRAIDFDDSHWQSYYKLAYNILLNGDSFKQVMKYYLKAHRLDPKNPKILNAMGVIKYKQQKYLKSIKYHKQALQYSQLPQYYYNLGKSQFCLNRYHDCIYSYTSALQLQEQFDNKDQIYYQRGLSYFQLKNYSQAIRNYNSAILLNQKKEKFEHSLSLAANELNKINDKRQQQIKLQQSKVSFQESISLRNQLS